MAEKTQTAKAAESTQVTKKEFTTPVSQWSNEITKLIARDYQECGVVFDDYSKKCALTAMEKIYSLVKADGSDMNNIDTSNIRSIVEQCASLKLNANAYPRECYFQLRNVKVGSSWVKQVEMGIEGAGNDAILTNYGKDVEQVYPYWVVKEGDTFVPPKHKGVEITPPEWEEKGLPNAKAIKVVYPVKLKNGNIQYLISDRESVKVNLFAHVRNNLMNETFGICAKRYEATPAQKKQIEEKKQPIYDALRKCETLDDMLACEIAKPYMSGAWLDTPESMIIRKMCNNATKKFPKNYDTMASKAFVEMDETYQVQQEEVAESANTVDFIDAEATEVTE